MNTRFLVDMVIDSLLQTLTLKFYKILDRFISINTTIDIFEQLHKAKQVLICAPLKPDQFTIAQQCFQTLTREFTNAVISLLLQENQVLQEPIQHPNQIITITKQNKTSFGFPQKEFISLLKKKSFDVVIDLSPDFEFLNTYLCRASGSKLRICLSNPKRDPFYNFLIRTDRSLPLERRYEILIHYLNAGIRTIEIAKNENALRGSIHKEQ
jgi:hypothetical protein